MKKKAEKKWKPEMHEWFWFIYVYRNHLECDILKDYNTMMRNDSRLNMGNCFRTKREAQAVCKKLNTAIRKILKNS